MVRDIAAQQVTQEALKRAEHAETRAGSLLRAAVQANEDAAVNPTSSNVGRRATLAREAYNAKMTATVSRVRAAFSLIAEQQGTQSLTARQAMQQVVNAQTHNTLVTTVKGGQLRRNIMMQAAQAAEKGLEYAPGLPAEFGAGAVKTPGAQQVTMGVSKEWRPRKYETVASEFFPDDIRAAASSLGGINIAGFGAELMRALNEDAEAVERGAVAEASKVAQQEPGAANLAQHAEGLVAQLKRRAELEQQSPVGVPWFHVAVGVAGAVILLKVL